MATTVDQSQRISTAPIGGPHFGSPPSEDEARQLVGQFMEHYGDRLKARVEEVFPTPHEISEVQRQLIAFEASRDRLVSLVLTTGVAVAIAWATVAATMSQGRSDFFFYAAGSFVGASVLTGCLYFKCLGWENFARLFSSIKPLSRVYTAAFDFLFEVAQSPPPKERQLVDQLFQNVDDHHEKLAELAVHLSFVQRLLLLPAVVFFLAWLAVKNV